MARPEMRILGKDEDFKNQYGNPARVIEDMGNGTVRVRFSSIELGQSVEGELKRGQLAPDNRAGKPVMVHSFSSPFDKSILKDVPWCEAYIGGSKYTATSRPAAYKRWVNMLRRVYTSSHANLERQRLQEGFPEADLLNLGYLKEVKDAEGQTRSEWQYGDLEWRAGRNRSYFGVEVSHEFLNFQNFAEWYYNQVGHNTPRFELDKDLLSPPGNKMYSPDTCCFLPSEINTALRHKKPASEMARLAELYQAEIDPRAYAALLNVKDA